MSGFQHAFSILTRHIDPESFLFSIYLPHVTLVTNLALKIARQQGCSADELLFIEEASLLHDIGIEKVNDPEIGCFGALPYIAHGYLGHDILLAEGLLEHALVAERHTGVGITVQDVIDQGLPIPVRSYEPQTEAEKIICYADLFFSKDPKKLWVQKTPEEVRSSLERFGVEKLAIFDDWHQKYKVL